MNSRLVSNELSKMSYSGHHILQKCSFRSFVILVIYFDHSTLITVLILMKLVCWIRMWKQCCEHTTIGYYTVSGKLIAEGRIVTCINILPLFWSTLVVITSHSHNVCLTLTVWSMRLSLSSISFVYCLLFLTVWNPENFQSILSINQIFYTNSFGIKYYYIVRTIKIVVNVSKVISDLWLVPFKCTDLIQWPPN